MVKKKYLIIIGIIIVLMFFSFIMHIIFKTEIPSIEKEEVEEIFIYERNLDIPFSHYAIIYDDKRFCTVDEIEDPDEPKEACLNEYYFFISLYENTNYCSKIKGDDLFIKFCNSIFENNISKCYNIEDISDNICNGFFNKDLMSCKSIINPFEKRFCTLLYYIKIEENRCEEIEEKHKELCNFFKNKTI